MKVSRTANELQYDFVFTPEIFLQSIMVSTSFPSVQIPSGICLTSQILLLLKYKKMAYKRYMHMHTLFKEILKSPIH